ncbi:hypothetical protein GF389_05005 [Candidatus Dojkabacteria bacterium]|nr:hypothetical protein [Candidatus Dojkabacteria bacterium]
MSEVIAREKLEIRKYTINPGEYSLRDFLGSRSTVLSEALGQTFPEFLEEGHAFRVILRGVELSDTAIDNITKYGAEYLPEDGVLPISIGNVGRSTTFLVPEEVRGDIRQNTSLLIQNPPMSDYLGSEHVGLVMIYDNYDRDILPVEPDSELCRTHNLRQKLVGIMEINF